MQDTYSVDDINLQYIDQLVDTEVSDGGDTSYLENENNSEDTDNNSESNEGYSEDSDYSDNNSESNEGYSEDSDYSDNNSESNGEYSEDSDYSDNNSESNEKYSEDSDYSDNNSESNEEYSEEGSDESTDSLYPESGENSDDTSGESVFYPTEGTNTTAQPEDGGNTIYVDSDFGGDLEGALASANNGDVVVLGNNRYYTSGITLNKDITIDGQEGSVIDGGGNAESVIKVTPGASNATIQNIEITNANNGIAGNGASNLTLQNLNVNNIGNGQTIRYGQNNTGIELTNADGIQILNSEVFNVGRKGIGIGATQGGLVSNVTVEDVNLDAQHVQSHDAAGIKFYNTDNVTVSNSYLNGINANHIWNDTTSGTTIEGNRIDNVGSDFLAPGFNDNVEISGIYNEKSYNSSVRNNTVTANDGFSAFNATEFTTQTMDLGNNNFSSSNTGTTDYWTNQSAETQIATTPNPADANFNSFSDQYYSQANIG